MYADTKQILIFKTNIRTPKDHHAVKNSLDTHQQISQWNIDMQDVDCVLRIESYQVKTHEIIALINSQGYQCSELE
ncbi:hypothetical protein SAMN05421788_104146 [Filimonas lacunae]|uniref:Copper chaperone CopZ n=1 Tax=Filimonas lacunae TaxID=477680 RepID=A0A173M9G7_9BACT|nr:hypothetical protein [Filimonas lacunae]BAV04118.1 hypothetical protein FLA_0097 [Filimonas lacunae]SIT15278.1 hypothetical protein SAMN05421788_104146 [Filimonas lacunae]